MNELMDCFTAPVKVEVNASQLRCPLPLLKVKQALRDLSEGEMLRMLATDAGSVRDIRSYCQLSGHELVKFDQREGVYCYLVRKANK